MVQTRSGKKTASVEGVAYSIASEEEMDSPRSQGQQAEDDVDPQMYVMFKKMMNKMLAEQAEASAEQTQIKQKDRDYTAKNMKIIKKQNRHEEMLDESESAYDTDKEYETKQEFKRSTQGQGSAYKSRNQSINDPTQPQLWDVVKMVKDLQARDQGKKVFTSEDFYDGLEGDDSLEDLPRKFVKFDGTGNPKAHLAMFFAECNRFKRDNCALFRCFPRSLEGTAAKWYSEHINPIELKEIDKVVNLFIERFLFNTEVLPTLNHLYNLKQKKGEKARDFIHRWRSTCNQMKDPISEGHALSVILNNFSQPLRGLISTSPARSFIELVERAEWLEMGLENGVYESLTLSKGSSDTKKSCVTFSVNTTGNNNGKSKRGGRKNHTDGSGSLLSSQNLSPPLRERNEFRESNSTKVLKMVLKNYSPPFWKFAGKFRGMGSACRYEVQPFLAPLPRVIEPRINYVL